MKENIAYTALILASLFFLWVSYLTMSWRQEDRRIMKQRPTNPFSSSGDTPFN